jgi:hypothetical protein
LALGVVERSTGSIELRGGGGRWGLGAIRAVAVMHGEIACSGFAEGLEGLAYWGVAHVGVAEAKARVVGAELRGADAKASIVDRIKVSWVGSGEVT